jgi:hypothetical protein
MKETNMVELGKKVVKEEDYGLISPCGIICLGCDVYQGEGAEAAKKVVDIWEGLNFPDISRLTGLDINDIRTTIGTLKKYIANSEKSGKCKGCNKGGGPSENCGISKCVNAKGYWTCAECKDYDPDSDNPCTADVSDNAMLPISSATEMSKLICKRYCSNTSANLKKCREIGYPVFIEEIRKNVDEGWRTWQIISNEMVFTEYISGQKKS